MKSAADVVEKAKEGASGAAEAAAGAVVVRAEKFKDLEVLTISTN